MSAFRSTVLGYEFAADSEYLKLVDMKTKELVDLEFMKRLEERFPRVIRSHWLFEDVSRNPISMYAKKSDVLMLMDERLNTLKFLTGKLYALVKDQFVCRYIFIDGEHRMIYVQEIVEMDQMGNSMPFSVTVAGIQYHASLVIKTSWEHSIPEAVARGSKEMYVQYLLHKSSKPGSFGSGSGGPHMPEII